MEVLVLVLVLALAAANGANDVPKGVATLAAAGVTKLRTAIIWGTVTTALGCLVSLTFAAKLTALFSNGIVSAKPTAGFAVAVLIGTAAWVALATWRKLPVSTTHALVGSLLGAGLVFASSSLHWDVLLNKVVGPLLLSVLAAYVISAIVSYGSRVLAGRTLAKEVAQVALHGESTTEQMSGSDTKVSAPSGVVARRPRSLTAITGVHWMTSGFTSFARGMNDAPKIVAVGSFALVGGMTPTTLLFAVTAVMAIGGLLGGARVASCMCCCVTKMSHVNGFAANLTTAALVGLGAFQGLPMSTTHVSVGAIAGTVGRDLHLIQRKTIRDFVIAWLVTPPFAAVVAAGAYLLVR
ncbi:inorganic phosphate transporter [Kutzneria sp. 744]|uniref:inorganic phosphate transporter n=1 Tax=Kutzneria sp. (strain 744) TaxID=345341 RepID=UPI0003EEC4FF|nr:inorganic phosphate transporter [Kutzneria sp. 744]EWM19020.1 phosphate transporter [Kutzneria sp. 744]